MRTVKNIMDDATIQKLVLLDKERAALIEDTNWAKDFEYSEVLAFATWCTAYRAGPGTEIFLEGDRDASLYFLVSGRVAISKRDRSDAAKQIHEVAAGKTFGEMALIDSEPRSASVAVTEEATWLVMTKDQFDKLCQETPRLGLKILQKVSKLLSQRLRQTSASLAEYLDQ